MFKIEKNIPIPEDGRSGRAKYPFGELDIGDSFLIKGRQSKEIGSQVQYWKKRTGYNFTVRNVRGGVRIWRTE